MRTKENLSNAAAVEDLPVVSSSPVSAAAVDEAPVSTAVVDEDPVSTAAVVRVSSVPVADNAVAQSAEVSACSDDGLDDIINLTHQQTGGQTVSESVMKAKLKTKFDPFDWSSTFSLREAEIKKCWPSVSLRAHWPFLFKPEGVTLLILIKK